MWIAILVAVALIACIVAIAVLASGSSNKPPAPAPTTAMTEAPATGDTTVPSEDPATDIAPTEPEDTSGAQPTDEPAQPTQQPTTQPTRPAVPPATAPATNQPAPPPATTHKPSSTQNAYPVASIRTIDTGPYGNLYPVIAGMAEPGDVITVQLSGSTYTATADSRGNWTLSGPYSGLAPGSQTVTARAALNPVPVSSQFTLASPPSTNVNRQNGVTLVLQGIAGASVQVIVDGAPSQVVTLNGAGSYSGVLNLRPGDHVVATRYYSSGRYGPATGPVNVSVS